MNATYTTRHPGYGYLGTAGVERITALTKDLAPAGKTIVMLVVAPLLGLAFVVALPIAGVVLAAWIAIKTATGVAPIVKRIALFLAAPFVGLAYVIALPFVGVGAMVYYAVRAATR